MAPVTLLFEVDDFPNFPFGGISDALFGIPIVSQ